MLDHLVVDGVIAQQMQVVPGLLELFQKPLHALDEIEGLVHASFESIMIEVAPVREKAGEKGGLIDEPLLEFNPIVSSKLREHLAHGHTERGWNSLEERLGHNGGHHIEEQGSVANHA